MFTLIKILKKNIQVYNKNTVFTKVHLNVNQAICMIDIAITRVLIAIDKLRYVFCCEVFVMTDNDPQT